MKSILIDWEQPKPVPTGYPNNLARIESEIESDNEIIRVFGTRSGGETHIYKNDELVSIISSKGRLEWMLGKTVSNSIERKSGEYIYHTKLGDISSPKRFEYVLNGDVVAQIFRGDGIFNWIRKCFKIKKLLKPNTKVGISFDECALSKEVAVTFFMMDAVTLV